MELLREEKERAEEENRAHAEQRCQERRALEEAIAAEIAAEREQAALTAEENRAKVNITSSYNYLKNLFTTSWSTVFHNLLYFKRICNVVEKKESTAPPCRH